jgi:hypothetical protein
MRFRRNVAVLAVALLAASGLAVVADVATAPAAEAAVVKKPLREAIRSLKLAPETRRGYDRAKFVHWVDADGDGCNTRYEVLIAEARQKPTIGPRCSLSGGRWVSYYDGQATTNPSSFDVDHMVPLAEAWDSGAKRWTAGTRKRFANDLADPRSLVAVTASSNRSKSDRDPAEWLPRAGAQCRYVREWTAVKTRWGLTVDRVEKQALLRRAQGCRNVVMTVRTARVVLRSTSGSTGGTTDGLDPRFDYCYQAKAAGYGPYVKGRDREYDWYSDRDGDGVVCE